MHLAGGDMHPVNHANNTTVLVLLMTLDPGDGMIS